MKWLCNLVSVLLVLVVSLLTGRPAKAGTTITITQSTCPIMINQPGEYDLATDVGPCTPGTDGIDILASDVTLHLDGQPEPTSTNVAPCILAEHRRFCALNLCRHSNQLAELLDGVILAKHPLEAACLFARPTTIEGNFSNLAA